MLKDLLIGCVQILPFHRNYENIDAIRYMCKAHIVSTLQQYTKELEGLLGLGFSGTPSVESGLVGSGSVFQNTIELFSSVLL